MMICTWSLRSLFLGLFQMVKSGSLSHAADEIGWVNLFNGKDLSGWIQKKGMAKYRVENSEVVGEVRWKNIKLKDLDASESK